MNADLLHFGMTGFVTLFVVVDPFGLVPLFAAMTSAMDKSRRAATLTRAVLLAFGLSLSFLLVGPSVLRYLGVTLPAFAISGGILLFGVALPMLFGQRAGLQAPDPDEEPVAREDIAVFPLAFPLLSGPGALTSLLLLGAQTHGISWRMAVLVVVTAAVYLLVWTTVGLGTALIARIGKGGIHMITRLMGMVLAAMAVQYVLNGATGYYHWISHIR